MSAGWADCPVCGAVVTDPVLHTAWHEGTAAWTADLANTDAPDRVTGPRWPVDLPVRPEPARPTPDPVTEPEPETPEAT